MTNSTDNMKSRPVNNQIQDDAAELGRKQDFLFQFIDHETGSRSEPFISDWKQMTQILNDREEGAKPHNMDYILLVAVLDQKQTHIPCTPLIHVERFLDTMPPKGEQ